MLIPFRELVERFGISVRQAIHAGAHLAEEASEYQEIGASAVLWIEANPDLIDRLKSTVAPYGHSVAQALLGAESGRTVTFHVTNFDSMSSSVLRFGTHPAHHPEVVVLGEQTHVMRTLDEVADAADFGTPDFLNLDLQGYELECLKGAEQVLRHARTVYTEVNVDELYQGCVLLPELDAWLNTHGFEATVARLYGSPRRDPTGTDDHFFGWGDCCYVRVDSPRPFAVLHPEDADDWFAPG